MNNSIEEERTFVYGPIVLVYRGTNTLNTL